jgi:site-specific DNA-methyltransferase (adenine-specific)
MVPITKHLGIQYDDIVPKFRNQKTDHSVWNYDMAPRSDIHVTPKPVALLKNLIIHTTDPGDTVLDCFAGTGSTGKACKELGRKCILIEKDEGYCEHITKALDL